MSNVNRCKLYVITGETYHPGRELLEVMESAIAGGADVVQLRDKDAPVRELLEKARALRELTRKHGVPLIVNDHPEIALAADADGVHLGQEDAPIAAARELLGPDRIVGISTHSIAQARAAERAGADYIGVGPVYPTATKPGRAAVTTSFVAAAAAEIRIPFFAIGGIHPGNAAEVLAAGARRLCAVSAVVGSPDPGAACRELRSLIERSERAASLGEAAPLGEGVNPGQAREVKEVKEVKKVKQVNEVKQVKEVTVNGVRRTTEAATLLELAAEFGLADKNAVAERNGRVARKAIWPITPLAGGDRIEFVQFVGGG
ncbi:thiamine phosphate synthase [Cohnella fermenti]|uniref:Thiamine-phosphate synthase n=1 Tax=Cohnella fermenti TaxID=2565925 RepID=A0A4S4BNX5_9BACL|nr:thiamine phosphate synthase [Cohnella fermenti]THF76037.1 thiamine phosphate synthase [Cohnella fermenti]